MIRVDFLGPMGIEPMEVDVSSLEELSKILKQNEEIAQWLDDCAVAVNDTMVTSLHVELSSGDRVSLLPPVCGG
ncbi:MAG: MoaD/ThiS family protein [Campylobacterota bacterium]|nr:MoaD/ThiS family protein [Campylobacterota bacterium]